MKEKIHDKGYKRVFSRKTQFIHLLKKYVMANWDLQLGEDDLELIDKQFVPKDFQEREADIIYKANLQGTEVVFYVLLELQSTVDYTMPFRLLMYMTELQKRIFLNTDKKHRKQRSFCMPPVIPIVFYNGESNWQVAPSYSEYTKSDRFHKEYAVDFKYLFLDLNKESEEVLTSTNRLLDNVFLLDKAHELDQFKSALKTVVKRMKALTKDEQNDLIDWIRDVLIKKAKNKDAVKEVLEEMQKGEYKNMTYNFERIFDKECSKARLVGREEGRNEGIRETVKSFLRMGVSTEVAAKGTGLTIEEVKALEYEIKEEKQVKH